MTALNAAMDLGQQAAARIRDLSAENQRLRRELADARAAAADSTGLHLIISEIRQIPGVGYRPMMADLPDVLRQLIQPPAWRPIAEADEQHMLVCDRDGSPVVGTHTGGRWFLFGTAVEIWPIACLPLPVAPDLDQLRAMEHC